MPSSNLSLYALICLITCPDYYRLLSGWFKQKYPQIILSPCFINIHLRTIYETLDFSKGGKAFFCTVRYLIIWMMLFPLAGTAQLLDNSKGTAFSEIPFFNETFIANNRIKSIHGSYTYKKMDDVMRETNYVSVYEFDRKGHLSQSYETQKGSGKTDTLVLFYGYDSRGNLEFVRKKDLKGFWSTHYHYDSLNRKIREEYRRDIDTAGTLLVPSFERSMILNFETMSYKNSKDQQTMTVMNNYGFPYLDEKSDYDENGYLISKEAKLKMTSQITTTSYRYTEKGWISKITTVSASNPNSNQEILFRYDDRGNLIEKHVFKNGVFITDIQVIYNDKTGLISYILTRDVATSFISILKFDDYDYY